MCVCACMSALQCVGLPLSMLGGLGRSDCDYGRFTRDRAWNGRKVHMAVVCGYVQEYGFLIL